MLQRPVTHRLIEEVRGVSTTPTPYPLPTRGRGTQIAAVDHDHLLRPKPRQSPGGAERGRDGDPRRDAFFGEACTEHLRELSLTPPEVGAAGDVEEQPVRRIDRHGGGDPLAPVREALERREILL